MADRGTLDVYAKRAAEYADRFSSDTADRHLQRFIGSVPSGGRVLDLGCGPGRSARFMVRAGLEVDAWDASPEMARIGREAHGLDIRIAQFSDLDATEIYDGVYANFSLLHAPKADMPGNLTRIATALKPCGLLHLGLKEGDGEARDKLGRFYAYYRDDELTDLLNTAGLNVETRDFGTETGLDGTRAPWIITTARKPA